MVVAVNEYFFFFFEECDENEGTDKEVWIADGASSGLYSLKQIHFSQVYSPIVYVYIIYS